MGSLSKYEQETVINFNAGEQRAVVYTRDKAVMRKLDALVIAFPEVYKLVGETDIDKTYSMPKSCVNYRKPRKLDDKYRELKEENQHKYMMGGIVHKYFPECYQFDEQELNRIIASGMKSEQCQRIIEIVKKESAEKRENAVVKAESEVAGDEGTGKSENA